MFHVDFFNNKTSTNILLLFMVFYLENDQICNNRNCIFYEPEFHPFICSFTTSLSDILVLSIK